MLLRKYKYDSREYCSEDKENIRQSSANKEYNSESQSSYNESYSQAEQHFRHTQEEARRKGKEYLDITLEELLSIIFKVGKETISYTTFGDRSIQLTIKDRIKIGLNGVLLILTILLSCTGVLAPIGVPLFIMLYRSLKVKGKYIGLVNLFISTLVMGAFVFTCFWISFNLIGYAVNGYFPSDSSLHIKHTNKENDLETECYEDDRNRVLGYSNDGKIFVTEEVSEEYQNGYRNNVMEDEAEGIVIEQLARENVGIVSNKCYKSEVVYDEGVLAYNFNLDDLLYQECYVVTCSIDDERYDFYVDKYIGNIYLKLDRWYQISDEFTFGEATGKDYSIVDNSGNVELVKSRVADQMNTLTSNVIDISDSIVNDKLRSIYYAFEIVDEYRDNIVLVDRETNDLYYDDINYSIDFFNQPCSGGNIVTGLRIEVDNDNLSWKEDLPIVPVKLTNIWDYPINISQLKVSSAPSSSAIEEGPVKTLIDYNGIEDVYPGESLEIYVYILDTFDATRNVKLIFEHEADNYGYQYITQANTRTSY